MNTVEADLSINCYVVCPKCGIKQNKRLYCDVSEQANQADMSVWAKIKASIRLSFISCDSCDHKFNITKVNCR